MVRMVGEGFLEEVGLALDLQRWGEFEYTELVWPKDHLRQKEQSEHSLDHVFKLGEMVSLRG